MKFDSQANAAVLESFSKTGLFKESARRSEPFHAVADQCTNQAHGPLFVWLARLGRLATGFQPWPLARVEAQGATTAAAATDHGRWCKCRRLQNLHLLCYALSCSLITFTVYGSQKMLFAPAPHLKKYTKREHFDFYSWFCTYSFYFALPLFFA